MCKKSRRFTSNLPRTENKNKKRNKCKNMWKNKSKIRIRLLILDLSKKSRNQIHINHLIMKIRIKMIRIIGKIGHHLNKRPSHQLKLKCRVALSKTRTQNKCHSIQIDHHIFLLKKFSLIY